MHDWNVGVSLHERKYIQARKLLEQLGPVRRTAYFNVLVMKVADISRLLDTLCKWIAEDPQLLTILARVMPVTQTFTFQTVEEFEAKAREASLSWVPHLGGKSFHIRMHRRGFKFFGSINGVSGLGVIRAARKAQGRKRYANL